jgi:Fe-S-cluster containining protein
MSIENSTHQCNRCGECCRWAGIAQMNRLSKKDLEYYLIRADKIDQGWALVHSPCKHLKIEFINPLGGDGERRWACDIYDTRPQCCRDFKGKIRHGRDIHYVPPGCSMVGEP